MIHSIEVEANSIQKNYNKIQTNRWNNQYTLMFLLNLIIFGFSKLDLQEFASDGISNYNVSKMYNLLIYDHLKYNSVEECLLTEYLPGSSAYKKYLEGKRKRYIDKEIPEKDLTDILIDKNNPLTDNEKFAIFLNTIEENGIYYAMKETLPKGVIGRFDCFFNYLTSGLQKIKPLKEGTLYRGTSNEKISKFSPLDSFKKLNYVSTVSFVSTSSSLETALDFAHRDAKLGDDAVIKIKACKNAKPISLLSSIQSEKEYLYQPATRFRLTSDPYIMWCPENCKGECRTTKADKYLKTTFYELEELNEEPGPYQVMERPTPSQSPAPSSTRSPSQSPYPTMSPSPTPKPHCVCSCDNILTPRQASRDLGNIPIKVGYIGGSAIFDFPLGYDIMRRARELIGRIIPSPNFLHTAIWVSDSDISDDSNGAIFVYGEYTSNEYDPSFLFSSGARSYTMTLKEFKKNFKSFNVKKIIPKRQINLFDLINEIKINGNWTAPEYNWAKHNCQHFTKTCISILQAERLKSELSDWTNLPKIIMKEILAIETI